MILFLLEQVRPVLPQPYVLLDKGDGVLLLKEIFA